MARSSEPIFNVPPVIMWLSAAMALIHGGRALLTQDQDNLVLVWFAFIPARYDPAIAAIIDFPGGIGADIWTFFTYAFLHAEIVHILANLVWLLAFGSAVAWRFGALRFLLFFAVTSALSAAAYLLFHADETVPVIGASGAISGAMAAACRFVFADGGPLFMRGRDQRAYQLPALPLKQALKNRGVVMFLVAWFLFNLLFGLSAITSGFTDATVAWEAHLGGFLAGLFLFRFFDPVPRTLPNVPLAPSNEGEET
ncbi:MAG TPA: rhomboid family intramembrane serine protease [Xanthobacteraceae bacterium]|nr:rhomboid family intramembrane serine protease [Xanthobacteraceae bacterium]